MAKTKPMQTLVELTRYYGNRPEMVLAGGGNTSVKVGRKMYIKASGTAMATIDADGFVAMDTAAAAAVASEDLGTDPKKREAKMKKRMAAACVGLQPGLFDRRRGGCQILGDPGWSSAVADLSL